MPYPVGLSKKVFGDRLLGLSLPIRMRRELAKNQPEDKLELQRDYMI